MGMPVCGDAGLCVVERLPAGAQTDLEPTARGGVDRGEFPGEDRRVAEVAVEHQGADAQLGRDGRAPRDGRQGAWALV